MTTAAPDHRGALNVWRRVRLRVRLFAVTATVMILLVVAFLHPPGWPIWHRASAATSSAYVLVQMNLCLSGLAQCFHDAHYPRGLVEARTLILDAHADAVTLDEACSGDVEALARATGYHMRFATVPYKGDILPCSDPGDRGRYGIAVLTRAGIRSSIGDAYTAQDDIEQRQWICVTTDEAVTVCATHLDVRASSTKAVNDAQCAEFADVLEGLDQDAALIAAGDMNRPDPCAPEAMWTRTDELAEQQPGLQHVYGNARFSPTATTVVPMTYSDHDALVVSSRLSR
jgi:endonuclease/exonuclease/phosphatase family metal-dependent hydrolase